MATILGTDVDDVLDGSTSNDVFLGGAGSDKYVIAIDEGRDAIFDESGFFDVLEVYGGDQMWSVRDNLLFRQSGDDLVVNLLDVNGDRRGSVTIQDMDNPSSQLEYIALMGADGITRVGDADPRHQFDLLTFNALPWARAGDDTPDIEAGEARDASSWWTASDPDRDEISWWAIWDENGNADSSYLSVSTDAWVFRDNNWVETDGQQLPAGEAVVMESDAFESLTAHGGSAGSSDNLWAIAWDGQEWGNWAMLTLNSDLAIA